MTHREAAAAKAKAAAAAAMAAEAVAGEAAEGTVAGEKATEEGAKERLLVAIRTPRGAGAATELAMELALRATAPELPEPRLMIHQDDMYSNAYDIIVPYFPLCEMLAGHAGEDYMFTQPLPQSQRPPPLPPLPILPPLRLLLPPPPPLRQLMQLRLKPNQPLRLQTQQLEFLPARTPAAAPAAHRRQTLPREEAA